ncbi:MULTISPECIES: ABC transporter ATP-binding protein [Dehalobacter]|jgi:cobalt/nickel transport system ATP-binding protein|uniref:Cobalt ABC transporter ATP-binding protein n=1 Tax=Dehalobacter restrictus (strain DSM 9455 / PER-K23) TaxID=871738 RepID=A0ABM5P8K4_DEHRP|nr:MULTISPECIES: ABC transporter ATP-binding protein [Dehalobacter]AHF10976.1 cobalt ABC transporter ATP-binding protein [Dehalobacter restrictus DSM 9455]MDJ0307076.1 ABC transporter ATP-binding protein [Dehalobacter sp.]OCZ49614.1 cobalt ABC transporter ATP-binding protein [Dehalobacter sp. TeCB1]
MSHHKLEARTINYVYPDGNKAVKDISFTIHHGESVGIVGANGAGKSTLLMLLMGVLFPSSGEVLVGDIHVTKKTLPLIRQRLGMVFQDPDDQLFMSTVYDDVAFGPRNYRYDEKEVESRVLQALEMVGILHLKDRPPFKLSGGEKRAAAIASVLSMQPDVLIMDEPTASLDPRSRRRVINLLNCFEHTKIITSHDLDMILDISQRVIVIKDGEIAADGEAAEILADAELLNQCGLEVPISLQRCPKCGERYFTGRS